MNPFNQSIKFLIKLVLTDPLAAKTNLRIDINQLSYKTRKLLIFLSLPLYLLDYFLS